MNEERTGPSSPKKPHGTSRRWATKTYASVALATFFTLMLFLVPQAAALTILYPDGDVDTTTTVADVDFEWTGNSSSYHILVTNTTDTLVDTNTTSDTYAQQLTLGSYTVTLTGTNESDTTTFDVIQLPPQNETNQTPDPVTLTLTVEESTYEVQDTVRLTATASEQVTATLNILLNGNALETYTLSITNSVGLIYIPEQPGTYTVTLTADGQTLNTLFTVTQTEALQVDFSHTTAVVDTQTTFTSTVTGGNAPYTYNWLFSDDTSSAGAIAQHYFFEDGPASATLVVEDSSGTQKSVTKSFTVSHKTYDLELTVQDEQGHAVDAITVDIDNEAGEDQTKTTTSLGTVLFPDLRGNYSIILRRIGVIYYNGSVNISKDTNLLLTINHSLDINDTPVNDTEPINDTPVNITEPVIEHVEKTTKELPQELAAQAAPVEETTTFEDTQETATAEIKEARFNLRLSAKKDQLLQELNLYSRFDEATAAIQAATTQEQIDDALATVPAEISIETEQAKLSYPDETVLEELTERYMGALNVQDESLQEDYAYSITQVAQNVSVKTEFVQATITFMDGTTQTHSIVRRDVQAPPGVYIVEIIPKQFAVSAAQLKITGDHEVIEDDPVIKFLDTTYAYSINKKTNEYGSYLVVPEEITSPSLLTGFVSFAFGQTDNSRAMLYTVVLIILALGLVAGPKLMRKTDTSTFDAFAHVTNEALTMIASGEKNKAAQLTPDIIEIYHELPQEQQEQLHEVIAHLVHNMEEQSFLRAIQEAYEHMGSAGNDVNQLSAYYEHVLQRYESLSHEQQEQLRGHIDQLDTYLESVMQT